MRFGNVLAILIRAARTLQKCEPTFGNVLAVLIRPARMFPEHAVETHLFQLNGFGNVLALPIRPARSHVMNSSCEISRHEFVLRESLVPGKGF